MTAFALGLLGLVLSLLVPAPLARARWTTATPAASVVLWQAVVAASVLSAVAVVLIAPEEIAGALEAGPGAAAWGLFGALAVALLIVTRLVLSLVGVMRRSAARRARHRELLDLLDDAERSAALAGDLAGDDGDGGDGAGAASRQELRVLGAPLPLAYGLPGRSPRVVVSDGALQLLDTDQLRAVLAHEQAHLDARHDVVLESFAAFHRAVPRPLRNERALGAVELLLEAAADDAARRRCGAAPLRSALELLGSAVDPGVGSLAAADVEAERTPDDDATTAQRAFRLSRLRAAPAARWRSVGVLALAAGVLVLPPVVLVAPWLTDALATLPLLRP